MKNATNSFVGFDPTAVQNTESCSSCGGYVFNQETLQWEQRGSKSQSSDTPPSNGGSNTGGSANNGNASPSEIAELKEQVSAMQKQIEALQATEKGELVQISNFNGSLEGLYAHKNEVKTNG